MKTKKSLFGSVKLVMALLVILAFRAANSAQIDPVSEAASDIDVGADGSIWVIGTDSQPGGFGIYQLNLRGSSAWTRTRVDGGAIRVAVDSKGNPWVVDENGNISQYKSGFWTLITGAQARDIDIDRYNNVWIADAQGYVRRRNADLTWTIVGNNAGASRIAVDIIGSPWVITTGSALLWRQRDKWINFNGRKATAIATGGNDSIWSIGSNKKVGELNGTGFDTRGVQNAKEVAVDNLSKAWVIDENGAISTMSGSNPLPQDYLRLVATQGDECQNLAKKRLAYPIVTTIDYDGDRPPDWKKENLPRLCERSPDYVATVRCFEENKFTIGWDKAVEKCRAPYKLEDARTVRFRNDAGFVAKMMVQYFVAGPAGVLMPKFLFTDDIPVGQSQLLEVPRSAPNTVVTISLIGTATVNNNFFSISLDTAFTGDPCYKAWGTLFSPQGGVCK